MVKPTSRVWSRPGPIVIVRRGPEAAVLTDRKHADTSCHEANPGTPDQARLAVPGACAGAMTSMGLGT